MTSLPHYCQCYSMVVKVPSSGVKRLNYSTPLNQTLLAEVREKLEDGDDIISIVGFK